MTTTATFPARTGTGASRQLAGTGALLRFSLRRDRVVIPTWVAVTGLLVLSLPGSLRSVYSTPAERADLARQMLANSSLRATYGPVFSDSLGGLTAWRIGGYAAILAGIMSLIVVVRHTRDEEESGRQELVSSAMVGRRAPLTAAHHLQRGAVLGWSLGFFAAGVAFGGITKGAADLVGDNTRTREIIERMGGRSGIENAFLATMVGLFGMLAALYAVSAVLRLHSEETGGRAEPILSNAVGRLRWAAGHLTIAFAGAILLMLLSALGLTLGYGAAPGPILAA
ncbi:ABC transporter permease, partial [Streptomyces sp. MBT65]|nr:ABC transporter permease [Streptomyces sp. MBT65]